MYNLINWQCTDLEFKDTCKFKVFQLIQLFQLGKYIYVGYIYIHTVYVLYHCITHMAHMFHHTSEPLLACYYLFTGSPLASGLQYRQSVVSVDTPSSSSQHHRAAFLAADNKHRADWTLQSRLHTAERGGPYAAETRLIGLLQSRELHIPEYQWHCVANTIE